MPEFFGFLHNAFFFSCAGQQCYSIIESAKANNINVFEFLTPILTELSKYENKPTNEQIEQFLP